MEDASQKNPARANRETEGHTLKKSNRALLRKTASFMMSLLVAGTGALILLLIFLKTQTLPASAVALTTQVVDMNGNVIDSLYSGQNRQIVRLNEISPFLLNATLAIEDRNFFRHFGFDLKGMARAALVNLEHMSAVQGASTLTQQLARNLYLSHERTWSRKMKEALYTIELEMQYSKQQILESYLNTIYYGHSTYGIEAAAQLFFGKDAKDLTLAESSLLAGIPKGPKFYSPFLNMKNAKDRQELVLQAMVEEGYISEQQARSAENEKLAFRPLNNRQPDVAPYFRDYVRSLAAQKLGISEEEVEEGGFKIITTLDLRAQKIAEETIAKHLANKEGLQAALISIDPRNGYIKAMVGGRNYEENQFNRVFTDTRQPGSAFKAIVYLTALQQPDFTAVSKFKSEPTAFTYDDGRQSYMPSNFNNHYANDYIDLRQAIAQSDNIFAVHTIMQTGPEKVIDMARRLGIQSPMKPLPSLALGTYPVSPFEMASAFAAIANQGMRTESTAILRIENSEGKTVYEANPKQERAVAPEYTYVLTNLMQSVFERGGTASRVAEILKRPVAGKTGTTNTDAWMVGFTPELSTAVWVGYDRDRSISAGESYIAAPIFAEFTERTLEPIPPKLFPIPKGVVSVYIDPDNGKLAAEKCPNARLESFVAGTEPQEYCPIHDGLKKQNPAKDTQKKGNKSWWNDLKRWWNS